LLGDKQDTRLVAPVGSHARRQKNAGLQEQAGEQDWILLPWADHAECSVRLRGKGGAVSRATLILRGYRRQLS